MSLRDKLLHFLRTDSLVKRLRRIALKTTILGVGTVPLSGAVTTTKSVTSPETAVAPIIVNRSKRSMPRLVFSGIGQDRLQGMIVQHRSHSSHSSHRSHYSGSTGVTPAPRTTTPATELAAPSADKKEADLQKLTLEILTVDKPNKTFTAKDEFGTEYKIGYTTSTKVITLGYQRNDKDC